MEQSGNKESSPSRLRVALLLASIVFVIVAMTPIFYSENEFNNVDSVQTGLTNLGELDKSKDSIESIKAFGSVYKVLMSPRCMNCHPSGDVPLQGDDSHLHTMLPRRGKDGKGLFAMKCSNCHQAKNSPGLHAPPGNATWHLPPADMKMVFQGRTPNQLAKQLLDMKQNGHKNVDKLLEHVSDDLVIWGWEPGEGRTKPPLDYEEFKKAWITWLEKGAYAPKP